MSAEFMRFRDFLELHSQYKDERFWFRMLSILNLLIVFSEEIS